MNGVPSLMDFYEVIADDARISALHVSLYMALVFKYVQSDIREPFQILRREIMQLAKISARHTYNKGMHELHDFGYIKYIPSTSRLMASVVVFKNL